MTSHRPKVRCVHTQHLRSSMPTDTLVPHIPAPLLPSTHTGAEAPAHHCLTPAAAAVHKTLAPFPPLHSHVQLFIFRGFINAASLVTLTTQESKKLQKAAALRQDSGLCHCHGEQLTARSLLERQLLQLYFRSP